MMKTDGLSPRHQVIKYYFQDIDAWDSHSGSNNVASIIISLVFCAIIDIRTIQAFNYGMRFHSGELLSFSVMRAFALNALR